MSLYVKYTFACSFNGTISHAVIFGNRQIHIKILNGGSKVIPNHFLLFLKFSFEYKQTGVALFPNISAMEIFLIVLCSWKIFISLASPSRPQPTKNTRLCSPLSPGGWYTRHKLYHVLYLRDSYDFRNGLCLP